MSPPQMTSSTHRIPWHAIPEERYRPRRRKRDVLRLWVWESELEQVRAQETDKGGVIHERHREGLRRVVLEGDGRFAPLGHFEAILAGSSYCARDRQRCALRLGISRAGVWQLIAKVMVGGGDARNQNGTMAINGA